MKRDIAELIVILTICSLFIAAIVAIFIIPYIDLLTRGFERVLPI